MFNYSWVILGDMFRLLNVLFITINYLFVTKNFKIYQILMQTMGPHWITILTVP